MADFNPAGGTTIANPKSGAEQVAFINALAAFALSSGYGATVPTNAEIGQIWAKNTGGTPDPMIFDGTNSFLIYSLANIIGAVTADGVGGNTGAIVEIGYTLSTLWVKFAGGLAICARAFASAPSGTVAWSLPVTFTDTAKMIGFGGGRVAPNARIVNVVLSSTSAADVYVFNTSNALVDSACVAVLIGFWTEEFV